MTTILKKQIVAITGLILVGFILGHMSGNLLFLAGPEAFNGYSDLLHHLGEILWLVRGVLLVAVIAHIAMAISLTHDNSRARAGRYAVKAAKREDVAVARKSMIYTGILIAGFVVLHLIDFTFPAKEGAATVIEGAGSAEWGLYGLVWNGFLQPWRAGLYVALMCVVGLHLSHGIQSLFQTVGFRHPKYTPLIEKASVALGFVVAIGFSLTPIMINIVRTPDL